MVMIIRELNQGLCKLEQMEDVSQTAYLTVRRKDGSEGCFLLTDALKEALNGNSVSAKGLRGACGSYVDR